LPTVSEQISRGQEYYRRHRKAGKFIAYFQTFTNTHAPSDRLRSLYDEALSQDDVIGLSIGTRPDCVPNGTLDLIQSYASHYHVWLEFGLQSIHDRTLGYLNRGHDAAQFLSAIKRAAGRNILVCTHIILGLPGETHADMMETAKTLSGLPIQGIKIHLLLALSGTFLGEQYQQGRIRMMEKEGYINTVCDILEILPPEMVIQRLTADGYRDIYLAPEWAVNKMEVLNAIDREMSRRDSWQGKLFGC
jgi:radical SAM protein (TIGR01212 family)